MALPTFNLPGKNIPDQKQMSMMRSYLSQLKDETESELYDIKWDNLSQSLRDKLNNLDTTVNQVNATADYIAGNLAANYVGADVIAANYASIGSLDAAVARIGTIEANYVSTSYLYSDELWAKTAFLEKVDGRIASFDYVNADYLSSNTLWADTAFLQKVDGRIGSFNFITANYITADRINTLFSSANFSCANQIYASTYSISGMPNEIKGGLELISWQSGTRTYYAIGKIINHG